MAITQVITTLPPAPQRSQPADFVVKADAHVASLDQMVTEENNFGDQLNTTQVEINLSESNAASSESNAASSESNAASSEIITQSLANFKGRWSDATGAATVPSSYDNNGQTWQLLQDIPDITLDEPVDGAANWQVINDINTANVQYDLINNPVSHFFAKNKIVERRAVGTTLKSTRPSGATVTDMYGTVATVSDDTPREQDNGWLAEILSTNLALQSEGLDTATWNLFNTSVAPDASGYAGLSNWQLITKTGSGGFLWQPFTTTVNGVYAISFFVKQGTGNTAIISLNEVNSGNLIFDFATKVLTNTVTGLPPVNGGYEELRDGVFRIWIGVTNSTGSATSFYIGTSTVDGIGTTILATGGQIEASPLATSYTKTTTTPETRVADNITADTFGNVPDLTKDWSFHFEVDLISLADIGAARRLFNVVDDRFFCQLVSGVMSIGNANTTSLFTALIKPVNVVTIVQEGVTTKVYVDGVLMTTGTVVWELLNTDSFYMGQSATNTSHANCAFKNVQWFDGALNIDSVKTMAVR